MSARADPRPQGFGAYIAVTAAYWAFMLTDGALRMLVLLHFHQIGFSPVQLAYLFVLYEIAGIVTNLSAGWIAARFGLTSTLFAGLGLQICALLALAQLNPAWAVSASVIYVMCVQGLSGVAKDLAKMSSKSAVKLLAPSGAGGLFRWVALLTGSKNAVKGIGFLLGALCLGLAGFHAAVIGMAVLLTVILCAVAVSMPRGLPQGRKDAKFKEVFSKNPQVNWLSAARVFLFGARDVWFVVGIPIYFYAVLSDGSQAGNHRAFFIIGSFMAVWTILYGAVQAYAPKLLRADQRDDDALRRAAPRWAGALAVVPLALAALVWGAGTAAGWLTGALILGLLIFGAAFAVNSALHSYLILAATTHGRVTMDVGFYYMANAAGRLLGTLMSGLCYQLGGVALCLAAAGIMLILSMICAQKLSRVVVE
ncbi:MFS transporter [Litorivita pollutaquae]|uniref:MFS transporter n=1 Tax=Litorivita pollutaquae TaxID=2200892 RepID=A0A2V4N2W8_9RHOB|nr:organoarsenical effux MFS transporter ArsJ [Litorivita pollutaquae]PYC48262.1 MFS transporter [Litorivita pollutaquae]